MNLLRALGGFALSGLTAAFATSCVTPPDYSSTPSIDFKSALLTKVVGAPGEIESDTITFLINYRDGDGDLGLSEDDKKRSPFNDSIGGRDHRGLDKNYFIQPFKKNSITNTWELFITPFEKGIPGEYYSSFPRLVTEINAKAAPIKGVLHFKLPLSLDGDIYAKGQIFRFEISILDRALHESNVITTSEVTLGH